MIKLGLMQGKLSPPYNKQLQFFPYHTWQKEGQIAKDIGFQYIEWIMDDPRFNPLMVDPDHVRKEIGIDLYSICADCWVDTIFSNDEQDKFILERLTSYSILTGTKIVIIPMLFPYDKYLSYLQKMRKIFEYVKSRSDLVLKISVEINWSVENIESFFRNIRSPIGFHDNVGICYDTGNRVKVVGPKMLADDIRRIGGNIINHVHIKDMTVDDKSCPIGDGVIDWVGTFRAFKDIGYDGGFTIQGARKTSNEFEDVSLYFERVSEWLTKAGY